MHKWYYLQICLPWWSTSASSIMVAIFCHMYTLHNNISECIKGNFQNFVPNDKKSSHLFVACWIKQLLPGSGLVYFRVKIALHFLKLFIDHWFHSGSKDKMVAIPHFWYCRQFSVRRSICWLNINGSVEYIYNYIFHRSIDFWCSELTLILWLQRRNAQVFGQHLNLWCPPPSLLSSCLLIIREALYTLKFWYYKTYSSCKWYQALYALKFWYYKTYSPCKWWYHLQDE